jgi:hypothetical protein
MEKGKSTTDAGELILESILCKLGRKVCRPILISLHLHLRRRV